MLDKAEIKTVYVYDNTGLYSGAKILNYTDRSPVSGAWQIPAGCTETISPAAKDNYDIVWNGTEWGYKEQTKSDTSPAQTFAAMQSAKLSAVDSAASAAYTSGFTSSANGTAMIYDSDSYTQTEIQTTAALAAASPTNFAAQFPNGFPIRAKASATAAKQIIYLTAAQLITLATDWVTRYKAIKAQVWALQTVINACTTAAAVEAITISIT